MGRTQPTEGCHPVKEQTKDHRDRPAGIPSLRSPERDGSPQSFKSQASDQDMRDSDIENHDPDHPTQGQFVTQIPLTDEIDIEVARRATIKGTATTDRLFEVGCHGRNSTPLPPTMDRHEPPLKLLQERSLANHVDRTSQRLRKLADSSAAQDGEDLLQVPITSHVSASTLVAEELQPEAPDEYRASSNTSSTLNGRSRIEGTTNGRQEEYPLKTETTLLADAQSPHLSSAEVRLDSDAHVSTLPSALVQHFQRWRAESLSGRYIPRYVQKIPRDQRQLLDSRKCWQPPLVGNDPRPGQIPFPLLQRLASQADNTNPSRIDPQSLREDHAKAISPATRRSQINDREPSLPSQILSEDDESEELSTSQWPPSSPRTPFRLQYPPDSSPLAAVQSVEQSKNTVPRDEGPLHNHSRPTSQDEMNRDHPDHLASLASPSPEEFAESSGITDDGQSDAVRLMHQGRDEESGSDEQSLETQPLTECTMTSIDLSTNNLPAQRSIQVKRTPHPNKDVPSGTDEPVLQRSSDQEIPNPASPPSSLAYVPGTFNSRSREVRPSELPHHGEPDDMLRVRCLDHEVEQGANSTVDRTTSERALASGQDGHDRQKRAPEFDLDDRDDTIHSDHCDVQTRLVNGRDLGSASGKETAADSDAPMQDFNLPIPSGIPRELVTENHVNIRDAQLGPSQHCLTPHTDPEWNKTCREKDCVTATGPAKKRESPDHDLLSVRASKRAKQDKAPNPATLSIDSDYTPVVEDLRQYPRKTLFPLSKHAAPRRSQLLSRSGSMDNVDPENMDQSRGKSAPHRHYTTSSCRWPSSPIMSTPFDHVVQTRTTARLADRSSEDGLNVTEDELATTYARFKTTYPDYEAGKHHFSKACILLQRLQTAGNAPHPFLYDDAIFHHYHSYRRYLFDVAECSDDALPFPAFYAHHIRKPSHLQGIVTAPFISQLLPQRSPSQHPSVSVDGLRSSFHSQRQLAEHLVTTEHGVSRMQARCPSPERDPAALEGPASAQRTPSYSEADLTHSHQPSVRLWLERAAGAESPELGTPDTGRSLEDVPPLSLPGSTKRPLPTIRMKSRPTISPFVKPATSAIKTEPWWKDDDTPFKRFTKQFSRLPSERGAQSVLKDHPCATSELQRFVNLFTWKA